MKPWVIPAAASVMVAGCGGNAGEDTVPDEPIMVAGVGFATPESVLHDATADVYLVSNINGSPTDTDDNGFISRLSPSGAVLDLKWIDGATDNVELNAPKGMTIAGDVLYVSDITAVRMFSRDTGAPMGSVVIPGTTFLNDLASGPDGDVYVTDSGLTPSFESSGTDAVYRIRDGVADSIAGGDLSRPNGVVVRGSEVWVVTFGANELFRVADGAKADVVTLPSGSLDGLVIVGDRFVVSSWEAEAVLSGSVDEPFSPVVSDVPAPADIGYDAQRGRLLIPLFQNDEVRIVPLADS